LNDLVHLARTLLLLYPSVLVARGHQESEE
jgi:hypothetical protein